MTATLTLTLADLRDAARSAGHPAEIAGTGGNVIALAVTVYGAEALVGLGDGTDEADTWSVSLDGATRERVGDLASAELPVTSDAAQTVADAAAWIAAAVAGRLCLVCSAPSDPDMPCHHEAAPRGHWSGCPADCDAEACRTV